MRNNIASYGFHSFGEQFKKRKDRMAVNDWVLTSLVMGSQPRKSCLWFWWTLQARPVFRSPHSLQGVPTNIHSFTSFKVLSALHCDKSLGVFRAIARSDAGIKSCSTEFRGFFYPSYSWLYKLNLGQFLPAMAIPRF